LILYQDTDSICLTDEKWIEETRIAVERADFLATSWLSYAEVRGVLARARRARRIASTRAYNLATESFEEDWPHYFSILLSTELVQNAGSLAAKHALTGADAIHLASVLALKDQVPDTVSVSTWDAKLAAAFSAEGISFSHEVTN
jgi:predicted nucleic acid-binding protein